MPAATLPAASATGRAPRPRPSGSPARSSSSTRSRSSRRSSGPTQFGLRLQLVGHPTGADRVEVEGSDDEFVARYLAKDGSLLAALAANRPTEVGKLRKELALAA